MTLFEELGFTPKHIVQKPAEIGHEMRPLHLIKELHTTFGDNPFSHEDAMAAYKKISGKTDLRESEQHIVTTDLSMLGNDAHWYILPAGGDDKGENYIINPKMVKEWQEKLGGPTIH